MGVTEELINAYECGEMSQEEFDEACRRMTATSRKQRELNMITNGLSIMEARRECQEGW